MLKTRNAHVLKWRTSTDINFWLSSNFWQCSRSAINNVHVSFFNLNGFNESTIYWRLNLREHKILKINLPWKCQIWKVKIINAPFLFLTEVFLQSNIEIYLWQNGCICFNYYGLFEHRIIRLTHRHASAKDPLPMLTHAFGKYVRDVCKENLLVLVDLELLLKYLKTDF